MGGKKIPLAQTACERHRNGRTAGSDVAGFVVGVGLGGGRETMWRLSGVALELDQLDEAVPNILSGHDPEDHCGDLL